MSWSYDPYLALGPYYDGLDAAVVFPASVSRAVVASYPKNLLYWRFEDPENLAKLLPFCSGVVAEQTALPRPSWRGLLEPLAACALVVFRLPPGQKKKLSSLLQKTWKKSPTVWLWEPPDATEAVGSEPPCPAFRDLSVDVSSVFHRGVSPTLQVAYLSAELARIISQHLAPKASSSDFFRLLERIFLVVPIEHDYFHQIAKLRAIHRHIDGIIRTYCKEYWGISRPDQAFLLPILSISGLLNKTIVAAHVNHVRNTSEAMSSLLGGTEALSILPHNARNDDPAQRFFSHRVALNSVNVLRYESDIRVAAEDPVLGSYFLTALTAKMTTAAWGVFRSIIKEGGFGSASGQKRFQKEQQSALKKKQQALQAQLPLWVGVSDFVKAEQEAFPSSFLASDTSYVAAYAGGRGCGAYFSPAPYEKIQQRSAEFFKNRRVVPPVLFASLQEGDLREAVWRVFALLGVPCITDEAHIKVLFGGEDPPVGWIWAQETKEDPMPLSRPPLFVFSATAPELEGLTPDNRASWLSLAEAWQKNIEDVVSRLFG